MSTKPILRLLIVDPSVTDAERMADVLRQAGHVVKSRHLTTGEELAAALHEPPWDLALVMADHTRLDVPTAQTIIREAGLRIPVIAVADHYYEALAVECRQAGAVDFVTRGRAEGLQLAVARELDRHRLERNAERYHQSLKECGKLFLTLLEGAAEPVAYIHGGMHILANRHYLRLFGLGREQGVDEVPVLDLVATEDRDRLKQLLNAADREETAPDPIKLQLLEPDGHHFHATLEFSRTIVNGESALQLIVRDQAGGLISQPTLQPDHGTTDHLTGIYSSQFFLDHLEQAVARGREGETSGALVYIELDNFQAIKETVGIAGSDQVLQRVAGVLEEITASRGLLARFSSDVFTWLILDQDLNDIQETAETIRAAVDEGIFDAEGQSVTLTVSVGMGLINTQTASAQTALSHADIACAVARGGGGNQVHLFNAEADRSVGRQVDERWIQRIRQALDEDGFRLVFMPIVSLHAAPQPRYEVLLRMAGPGGEDILPDQFLYPAEQAGLSEALDRWVIGHTIDRLRTIDHGRDTIAFIKVSAASYRDAELLPWVAQQLKAAGLSPGNLVFEINEADAASYLKEAKTFLNAANKLGCAVALEHFGTQQESFKYLRHLEAGYLKIDGSLVHDLPNDRAQQERVRAILHQAHQLKKQTVAEYVQDANTLAWLWQAGVNLIQGYYLQRPDAAMEYDFSSET